MKRLWLVVASATVLSVGFSGPSADIGPGAVFAQSDRFVQGALSLPRNHRYEVYEPGSGNYTPVDVSSVPDRVARGDWVYDRTENVWVSHPSVGAPNPRFATSGSGSFGRGSSNVTYGNGLALPRDHRYEVYANGSYQAVDVSSVASHVQNNQEVYDRTAGAWVYRSSTGLNPQYAGGGRDGYRTDRWSDRRDDRNDRWDRISGTVERVDGDWVVIRTNDGRTIRADLSQARDRSRSADDVRRGDRIVVGGVMDGDRLLARFYRDGREGDATQAPQGDWQRIHGRVQSIEGNTLRFRADDGRVLIVDMRDVNPNVRRALVRDEGATLIGFAGARANEFRAEYIQQDSSDPSRGGRIVPSASPR